MLAVTTRYLIALLLSLRAIVSPRSAFAQGRGWPWFQSCSAPTTMVLDKAPWRSQMFGVSTATFEAAPTPP